MVSPQRKFARQLRRNQTDAERKLWHFLRSRGLNRHKFHRQHPMGSFIVDFCSLDAQLIIELDGGQHIEQAKRDAQRTELLQKKGFKILRFWDNDILNNTEAVLKVIWAALPDLNPSPSSRQTSGESPVLLVASPHRGEAIGCLLVFLLFTFSYAQNLSHVPAPEPDANETIRIEKDCLELEKQSKDSPDDKKLKKRLEVTRQVLYHRHFKAAEEMEKQGYFLSSIGYYQRALFYKPQDKPALKSVDRVRSKLQGMDKRDAEEAYDIGMRAYQKGDKTTAADYWKRALELDQKNEKAKIALEQLNPQDLPPTPAANSKTEEELPIPVVNQPDKLSEGGSGTAQPKENNTKVVIPKDPDVLESLWEQSYRSGTEHFRFGDYEGAQKAFKKALKYSPDDVSTQEYLTKVQAILSKKNNEKSKDFYWLGVKALQGLDYRSAYRYLSSSVEADPSNPDARKLLTDLIKKQPDVLKDSTPQTRDHGNLPGTGH